MAVLWRNWAGDQACRPARFARPGTLDEVRREVARADELRVAGAGHSFSPAVLTAGTLLSLDRMDGVLDVDRASGHVRVQGGITLNTLSGLLWREGLAFENLGDIDVQSIAGATATGTHGTGGRLANLSASLEEVELVTGDGDVVSVARTDSDPAGWRAARVSLGALGVVTAVTLRAVPAFVLDAVDRPEPLDEVLASLDERAARHDHFELFAFPHCETALTRTNDRTGEPPRERSAARAWADEVLLKNHAFHAACRLARARPALIPRINRGLVRAAGVSRRRDRSYRIFATPRLVPFTEMEYAVPRAHTATMVREVLALIEERGFAVPFPIEVRFVAPDDALLSPAGGRETGYVAVHMFAGMEWEPYFRAVEEIARRLDGRPHWGKRHFRAAADLAPAYPQWEAFGAVRARMDPDGRFANGHLDRVLGPVGAPVPAVT